MQEMLWTLLGMIITPLLAWIASLVDRTGVVKFLVRLIGLLLKDPKARNKVENVYGVVLMELGLGLITFEKDDDNRLKKITQELEWKINELKKIV